MSMSLSLTKWILIITHSNIRTKSANGPFMLLHSLATVFGKFESQFKFILIIVSTTLDISISIKSLFPIKSL